MVPGSGWGGRRRRSCRRNGGNSRWLPPKRRRSPARPAKLIRACDHQRNRRATTVRLIAPHRAWSRAFRALIGRIRSRNRRSRCQVVTAVVKFLRRLYGGGVCVAASTATRAGPADQAARRHRKIRRSVGRDPRRSRDRVRPDLQRACYKVKGNGCSGPGGDCPVRQASSCWLCRRRRLKALPRHD